MNYGRVHQYCHSRRIRNQSNYFNEWATMGLLYIWSAAKSNIRNGRSVMYKITDAPECVYLKSKAVIFPAEIFTPIINGIFGVLFTGGVK